MNEFVQQDHNPYVGLRPFFLEDSLYFFGRDQQTAELLETLHRERFLAVVGSSGCGKSSMVRAGLIPMLLGGFLVQDRDRWSIVRMKPGGAPMANLAAGLAEIRDDPEGSEDAAALNEIIHEQQVDGVVEFLRRQLQPDENVLILVDQFEELFAFRQAENDDLQLSKAKRKERARRRAEAAEFVDLILRLSERRDMPVYVTMTMRTDFLGDCDVFYGLPEAMNRGRYLVPRLTRQQLREAIHGPVLLMREKIAPRLLDRLLNELGDRSDRLPVLQHALLRTWDEWRAEGGVGPIDIRHFDKAGGLDGALSQDAKRALAGLDRDVSSRIFKCLTDTDVSQRRIRRPARISELAEVSGASREAVEQIITRFREDRRSFLFPSADGIPDDPRVDMAHESLIRQWDDLRNWVDEERVARDQFLELVERGRGGRAKLQDPDLTIALDWRSSLKPTKAWAERYARESDDFEVAMTYLDESQEEAEAEARRERELVEKEKRLAQEEKERLQKAGRRRTILAGVFGIIAIISIWMWGQVQWFQRDARAKAELINNLGEMLETWSDDTVTDPEIRSAYSSLLVPFADSLSPAQKSLWDGRLEALESRKQYVDSIVAVDESGSVSVPEKVDAWTELLSRRPPRNGTDTQAIDSKARARLTSLKEVLRSSFEVRDGIAICARDADRPCPETPSCTGVDLGTGDQACLYAIFDTHDPTGRRVERADLSWVSLPEEETLYRADITGINGRSFGYNGKQLWSSRLRAFAPDSSEIQIRNRNGELVFRQVLDLGGTD